MVDSYRSIIELWSSREAMAADLGDGADAGLMSKWWQRNKIPDKWWVRVSLTEKARREGVTLEVLARLAAGAAAAASEEART